MQNTIFIPIIIESAKLSNKGIIVPLVQITNKTLQAKTEETEEIFDLALNAFKLLADSHRDLLTHRKRLLMMAMFVCDIYFVEDKYIRSPGMQTSLFYDHGKELS